MHIFQIFIFALLFPYLFVCSKILKVENQFELNENLVHNHAALYSPRHVHISYGHGITEMFVTWSTVEDPNGTVVEYGLGVFEQRTVGNRTLFKTGMNIQYIHRVHLKNLVAGSRYVYHCGSDAFGWSDLFSFTVMKEGSNWSPRVVVYGDLGNENAQSLARLQEEAVLGKFDAIVHNGDFAYDMDMDDGHIGDAFMEQIQPIAAYYPYMTSPGNHEQSGNFSQYKNRFTMPGNFDSIMYSWNMGPIHFIGFSTEVYYFLQYGLKQVVNQYEWLKQDLMEANKAENRKARPWIITYGHRPMYCSDKSIWDDCSTRNALVRVGIPTLHMFGLEDLFNENGVDLAIWAHEHAYERLWPLYNYTVLNGSLEEPYTNPKAMVHITTGSAGCKENHSSLTDEMPAFVGFRSTDYGYSRIHALDKTKLIVEQISDDQNGKIIDSFTIIRDKHEPYTFY